MMNTPNLEPALIEAPASRVRLVETIAPLVFRTDFESPGHVLLDLGVSSSSHQFRRHLIDLGRGLAAHYQIAFGQPLLFASVSRFDQQRPTRPHRDGGPDGSILLLGYEPTSIPSSIHILDYSRAAADRNLTPAAFLDCCNPAFGGDPRLLESYTQEVRDLCWDHYQILIINNSCLSYEERFRGMLGVLHHAVISKPNPAHARVIHSLLLGLAPQGLTEEQINCYVETATSAIA